MLEQAGYDVVLRSSHIDAESLDHEGHFALILLTLHRKKLDEPEAMIREIASMIAGSSHIENWISTGPSSHPLAFQPSTLTKVQKEVVSSSR